MKLDRSILGAGLHGDSAVVSTMRPKVVLIEDDRAAAHWVLELLTRSIDCDVRVVATGGADGLAAVAEVQPQVVVAGLGMLRRSDLTPEDFMSSNHSLVLIDLGTAEDEALRVGCPSDAIIMPRRGVAERADRSAYDGRQAARGRYQ